MAASISQLPTIDEDDDQRRSLSSLQKFRQSLCLKTPVQPRSASKRENKIATVAGNILACIGGSHRDRRRGDEQAGKLLEEQESTTSTRTVEMLEWQLEYLQGLADREEEAKSSFNCFSSSGKSQVSAIPENIPRTKLDVQSSNSTKALRQNIPSDEETVRLERANVQAALAIRKFCQVLIKLMEASGYSVWRALSELQPETVFQNKAHTVFALESRLNGILFRHFENESFEGFGITQILDPCERAGIRLEEFQRLRKIGVLDAYKSDREFANFCSTKTKQLWAMASWRIVFETDEERSGFTNSFMEACRGVWLLHRLAFSMEPVAEIMRVGKGTDVDLNFVEPVLVVAQKENQPQQTNGNVVCPACQASNKVDFMVMPGFRSQNKVIKCQVYPHLL